MHRLNLHFECVVLFSKHLLFLLKEPDRSVHLFTVYVLLLAATLLQALVNQLFVGKAELTFRGGDFLLKLTFVEGLLCNDLTSKILELTCQSLFNGVVLLAHDVSPDHVQLVKN